MNNKVLGAWGKFNPDDNSKHPLVDHCLDVATVFRALLDLPRLARITGLSTEQKARLATLAYLHDFGKCNQGFQAKSNISSTVSAGHVMEAVAWLLECSEHWPNGWATLMTEISEWFVDDEQALQMMLASISHHGRPVSFNDYDASSAGRTAGKWWSATAGYDPRLALQELVDGVRVAFPEAFQIGVPAINATPELQQRFAGLLMLADWVGSDTQFFPFRQTQEEERSQLARDATHCALRSIGLIPPDSRVARKFTQVFPFSPTPLQAALAEEVGIDEDTSLLLVESDTGSGKTEAALAWFFRLYAKGQVDGLYFALPTRVAARELYERVRKAIEAAFDPEVRPGPVILAVPGYAKVDGMEAARALTEPDGILWEDNAHARWRERMWSAERPKRFLAAPVAVGTVDQALLSVLQVKHSLLRSVCLDRHLLVVDEVHASDPYMREILRALLRGHCERGGYALLLSATLGETAAASCFDRPSLSLDEALARPYPLVSSRHRSWTLPAAGERQVQIQLSPCLNDDEALLPALVAALQSGARVLVVCNTVSRANALFQRIEAELNLNYPQLLSTLFALKGIRCPHHGRFAREDREQLDAAVTDALGKGSPSGARLLIGTQTLEQSLDIDADWLVSDLAPMDVLIQRIGRLHRHRRETRPPGFQTPAVLIRVPDQDLASYLRNGLELRAPAGLGSVYSDGRVLARTWDELQKGSVLELPRQARELIERTTHPSALEALPDTWRAYGHNLLGLVRAEIQQALRSVLDDQPFGELHYADKSERIATRLGHPTVDLPLQEQVISPFGAPLQRVAIPAHWLPVDEAGTLPTHARAEPSDDGVVFSVGKARFRYSRYGLEKDDA